MRFLQPRPLAMTLSVLVLPTAPLAQTSTGQNPESDAQALPEMVISAKRNKRSAAETPQKTTVITREQIVQQQALSKDSGEVLSNLIPSYSPGR